MVWTMGSIIDCDGNTKWSANYSCCCAHDGIWKWKLKWQMHTSRWWKRRWYDGNDGRIENERMKIMRKNGNIERWLRRSSLHDGWKWRKPESCDVALKPSIHNTHLIMVMVKVILMMMMLIMWRNTMMNKVMVMHRCQCQRRRDAKKCFHLTCFFFNLAICDSALAISLSTLEIFWSRSSLVLLTSSLSAVLSSGVGLIASTWGW